MPESKYENDDDVIVCLSFTVYVFILMQT